MIDVECGIKAFDVHELLCHYVACELGLYDDEGLRVTVRDRTFTPDAELPQRSYFQVACGAAFLGRRQGMPFRVVFATCTRPMFWLHAAPGIGRVEELAGHRVATYPAIAPPHSFARLTLRRHGLDGYRDLSLEPVRDDAARLGLLAAGEVQGAVLSSALSPSAVQRRGLRTLALLGDHVRFVTTGIAVLERMLEEQAEAVAALVRVFGRALGAIHREPDRVLPVVERLLGDSDDAARATYDAVRHCFTEDGRAPYEDLQQWVEELEAVLPGDGRLEAHELYDFSLLP